MHAMWLDDIHLNPHILSYFQMKENDRVVLETLLSMFNSMLEELPEAEESDRCYTQTHFVFVQYTSITYQLIRFPAGRVSIGM